MARLYKLEVQRNGINAIMYYHDDGKLELLDPDSGESIDYLQTKLRISELMFEWCKKYGITNVECSKET